MPAYALIKNNTLLNVCEWDGAEAFNPGEGIAVVPLASLPAGIAIGSTKNSDGTWSPPAATPPTIYTFLQFMALFTGAEQDAIIASTNTQVKLFVAMATGSGGIELDNPEVVTGVNYLVSVGLITAQRATQIFAGQAPA